MQGIDISAASRTETNRELMTRSIHSAGSVTSAEKPVQDFVAAGLVILEPRCLGVLAPLAKWWSDNNPPKRRQVDWLGPDHAEQIRDLCVRIGDERLELDRVIAVFHAKQVRELPDIVKDLVGVRVLPFLEEREVVLQILRPHSEIETVERREVHEAGVLGKELDISH